MDKNSYIAVFDSGVGGVSVLRELRALMPGERFYYFGDSANAPYGKKTTEKVRELTLAAGKKLLEDLGCKALVVACNTATAAAIIDLRENYFPFTFHFHALEKEMATHSSVLAWRIPGMGEPGELPSMGLHRVGHD